MRKNDIIRKALGLTYTAYDNCRHAHFQMWCNRYATLYCLPLDAMVKDDHLQNWYHDQWLRKVELAFYVDNQEYLEANITDTGVMQDLFLMYPDNLLQLFPKSLLDDVKKRQDTNKRVAQRNE